ncbi:MAG: DNA-3-methyladenine glycosylase 2 family protein, partial [Planctomycetaceae bacterium]|nr:DNA-3-methyladenine glycosylase 2 family protein [Planctomycetaceae bacterium]
DLVGKGDISAESLGQLTPAKLRMIGVSNQKSRYLLDLADKVNEGLIEFRSLNRRSDEEIIEGLTQVKGIGVWTAQMYLIFSLGRLDVFPWNDLGVRTQMQRIYGLAELPGKEESHSIAEAWRPYASVASWYCWRHGDLG